MSCGCIFLAMALTKPEIVERARSFRKGTLRRSSGVEIGGIVALSGAKDPKPEDVDPIGKGNSLNCCLFCCTEKLLG